MKSSTLSLAVIALIGNVSASAVRGWVHVDIKGD